MMKLVVVVSLVVGACASAGEAESPAKAAQEVVPGAARIRGGGVRMDVEVGRTFQRPLKNGSVTATPAAAVIR